MKYDQTLFCNILIKYNIAPSDSLCQDFENIMLHQDIISIFADMHSVGLLGQLLPEFLPTINLDQKNLHHCYTVDQHILHAIKNIALMPNIKDHDKKILLWASLLHDIGKPIALRNNLKSKIYRFTNHAKFSAKLAPKILTRFGVDKKDKKQIFTIIQHHEFFRYIKTYKTNDGTSRMTTEYVFDLIKKIGPNNFKLLILLHYADYMSQSTYLRDNKQLINTRAVNILDYYLAKNKITL